MLRQLYDFLGTLWRTIVPEGAVQLPENVYSIISLAMRYWFLLLMALIILCAYRLYHHENHVQKKETDSLPDFDRIGELLVLEGNSQLPAGAVLPVSWEGTIGSARTNDIILPDSTIHSEHLWFRFDESQGLFVYPVRKARALVSGVIPKKNAPGIMIHGSCLQAGPYRLRLRLFAGFSRSLYPVQPVQPVQQVYPAPVVVPVLIPIVQPSRPRPAQISVPRTDSLPPPSEAVPAQKHVRDNRIFMRPKDDAACRDLFAAAEEKNVKDDSADAQRESSADTGFYPLEDDSISPEEDASAESRFFPLEDDSTVSRDASDCNRRFYPLEENASAESRFFPLTDDSTVSRDASDGNRRFYPLEEDASAEGRFFPLTDDSTVSRDASDGNRRFYPLVNDNFTQKDENAVPSEELSDF